MPSTVVPFRNVTEPVTAAGLTRAVNVKFVLYDPDVGEMLRVVVVALRVLAPTVTASGGDFEERLAPSPSYLATSDWAPGIRLLILNVQLPPDNIQVPSMLYVLPTKVTIPVGLAPVTVATNVTLAP